MKASPLFLFLAMMKDKDLNATEYREQLNAHLTVIHRRDAVPTTTDALLLAAFLERTQGTACELGAGGGIVSLLAASRGVFPAAHLVEREPLLAELAVRNAKENGLSDRLRVFCEDIRRFDARERYAAVFANPPYRRPGSGRPAAHHLADVSRFERAGGIVDFCLTAARLLRPDGSFSLVYPTERRENLLAALKEAELFPTATVTVRPYPGGESRRFLLRAGKRPLPHEEHTLFLARAANDRRPTDEAEQLYRDGTLPF